jgi:hypothetical protein
VYLAVRQLHCGYVLGCGLHKLIARHQLPDLCVNSITLRAVVCFAAACTDLQQLLQASMTRTFSLTERVVLCCYTLQR